MIHEFRTYDLKPGTTPQFLKKTGEKVGKRVEYSPLVGFFYSEIGELNQALHIWQYDDMNQRADIRAKVVEDGVYPPDTREFLEGQKTEFFIPAPFLPELPTKRNIGPLFELRVYKYPPGGIPKVIDAWSTKIEARMELSKPVGVWYSDVGNLNQWAHMWAYESWEHRTEARKEFASVGWPPASGVSPITMRNTLMYAAEFSPVQ